MAADHAINTSTQDKNTNFLWESDIHMKKEQYIHKFQT